MIYVPGKGIYKRAICEWIAGMSQQSKGVRGIVKALAMPMGVPFDSCEFGVKKHYSVAINLLF